MIFTRNSCSVVLLENLELPYRIPTLQQSTQQGEIIKLTGFYSAYVFNTFYTFFELSRDTLLVLLRNIYKIQ